MRQTHPSSRTLDPFTTPGTAMPALAGAVWGGAAVAVIPLGRDQLLDEADHGTHLLHFIGVLRLCR